MWWVQRLGKPKAPTLLQASSFSRPTCWLSLYLARPNQTFPCILHRWRMSLLPGTLHDWTCLCGTSTLQRSPSFDLLNDARAILGISHDFSVSHVSESMGWCCVPMCQKIAMKSGCFHFWVTWSGEPNGKKRCSMMTWIRRIARRAKLVIHTNNKLCKKHQGRERNTRQVGAAHPSYSPFSTLALFTQFFVSIEMNVAQLKDLKVSNIVHTYYFSWVYSILAAI